MRLSPVTLIAVTAVSGILAGCSAGRNASLQDPNDQEQAVSSSDENIEGPDFIVVASARGPASFTGSIELRRYEPTIVAETTVQAANRDAASEKGFGPLAAFIFGKNRPSAEIAMTAPVTTSPGKGEEIAMTAPVTTSPENGEEIAMTAPVTTRPGSSDTRDGQRDYTVRFTMPAKYTMNTLPKPVDPAIRIVPMPARRLVALRFTGQPTESKVSEAERAIAMFVQDNGLTPDGPFAVAGYDGPSVPKSQQRWEVQLPLK